jgi:hypothetical protein
MMVVAIGTLVPYPQTMLARQAVLLTPSIASHPVTLSPIVCSPNSFSCITYQSPRKCCKQTTYAISKSFRFNTYKKQGWVSLSGPPRFFPYGNTLNSRPRAHPSVITASHFLLSNLNCHLPWDSELSIESK